MAINRMPGTDHQQERTGDQQENRSRPVVAGRRFTLQERSWIAYDWANSVYATIIMAAVFPIYFANVAAESSASGDVWWGYGTSAATLTVALLAPLLGSIADVRGMKKRFFAFFLGLGLVFTTTMALTANWQLMLVGYIFSYIGYSGSLLFYDAFITDVTTPQRMDKVSAWGYAMGYIGGSTIPFILSIALIMFGSVIGVGAGQAVRLSVVLTVVWWAVFSYPMLRHVRQVHYKEVPARTLISSAFSGLRRTILDIVGNKAIFVFMIAYFFYIDGVNTVIHMATVYGSSLGLGSTGMILALLVTQIVAVPFSILFSQLARRFGTIRMITSAIVVYFLICLVGFYMGFSLEPHQARYEADFAVALQKVPAGGESEALSAAERPLLVARLDALLADSKGLLAEEASRVSAFAELAALKRQELADEAGDPAAANRLLAALDSQVGQARAFLADGSQAADYDAARRRAAVLFWAMAGLVGTVQGGIQALSRSFFGKLIPPQRSNEFFGFFDIFGKFAAVMGPALYAFFAHLTGRSSFGILALIFLFAVGLVVIATGRRHLADAERLAARHN